MKTILSGNSKCGCSINLPIKGHCTPTKNCIHCCYARRGRTSLPSNLAKQARTSAYLSGKNISQLIEECQEKKHVRLCGTGDLLPAHVPNILKLARTIPDTQFWGMTRKPAIATRLNGRLNNLHLLLSVDGSSPPPVWNYQGALCWGPRLAGDQVPNDPRIKVVFPYHSSGRVVNAVKALPRHPKDCQAVWDGHKDGPSCGACRRCWSW